MDQGRSSRVAQEGSAEAGPHTSLEVSNSGMTAARTAKTPDDVSQPL
jgi:hypothetical protein